MRMATGVGRAKGLLAALLAAGAMAAAARPAEAQGTGAYAEYFDNIDFVPTAAPRDGQRVDPTINFNWGNVPTPFTPDAAPPGITDVQTWSARWSGLIEAPATGSYTFNHNSDDGVRVWVDGLLILDRWRDQAPTSAISLPINLAAGQRYGLRVDYFQNPGNALISLQWLVPGAGGYVVVPQAALYPDVAPPKVSPAAGTYSDSVTVTMVSDTHLAEIRYTTDGSVPTGASTLYTGPFVVAADTTVRAIGRRPGTLLNDSAVTTVVYAVNDILRPSIVNAQTPTATQVVVVFSEAVDQATAQTAANYTFSDAVTASAAVLSGDLRTVFLTRTAMTPGTPYTLTVANVRDRDVPFNTIAPGSGIAFIFPNFPTVSLTNYYPLEEGTGGTTADLVGGNMGTLAGTTGPPGWILGYLGTGLSFDGIDDSVTLASSLTPVLGGSATLACWVRTRAQGNIPVRAPGIAGGLIASNATDANDVFWGWVDEFGRIAVTAGTTIDIVNPEVVPANDQPNTAYSAAPINDGQWHHVAFTRNAGTGALQVYVDGNLSGTGTGQTGALTAVCQTLGRITNALGSAGHPVFFLGDLDDVRIFGAVLTQAEVRTLANRPPAVNAGPDQSLDLGQSASLSGVATDDGFPSGTLTYAWTASPAAGVVFSAPNSPSTTATFPSPGIYVLRLTVSDGALATSDELIVSYAMATVTPLSITTTEAGPGTAQFSVVLNVAPLADVTIAVFSTDLGEGTVSTALLTFTPGNFGNPQMVTVTGVDDPVRDGNIAYTIVLDPATSTDPAFNGYNAADVSAVNIDDEVPPPPKRVWGNCGSLGLDVLAPLGLLALLRRRRPRAGR